MISSDPCKGCPLRLLIYWNKSVALTYSICLGILSQQMLVPRTCQGQILPTSLGRRLKVAFDHLRDFSIWCRGDVPKWRPGNFLIWRPIDVLGRLIVPSSFSGRSQNVPRWPSKHVLGMMWGHLLDAPKFPFVFLSEIIWLTKFILRQVSTQDVFRTQSTV